MFDAETFTESLNGCRRAGDLVFVPVDGASLEKLRADVRAVLEAWCTKHGIEAGIREEQPEGITVMIAHIKSGSPMRARVMRPWFLMDIGEQRFVSDKEIQAPSLRAYVSLFCAKIGQAITVQRTRGGCTITRTR
ncbi:hypothetical protein [Bradyrhizobium sp.]|uniref:hypothetical protein n=1 Tax=Bradyrhizobium sp. TaxID=376 RepID=UPI0039E3DEA7